MDWLFDAVRRIYAVFAMMPFLSFAVIWTILYLWNGNKKLTTRITMDITFILLIGAVSGMLQKLTGSLWGFWAIILTGLIAAGLIGGRQHRIRGRIHAGNIYKCIARAGFLILSVLYIVLFIVSIVYYMTKS